MGDKTYTVVACNTIAAYHEVTAASPESAADVFYQEHGTPRTCHACPEADGDGWCVVLLDGEEVYTDQHDPSATTITRLTRERDDLRVDAEVLSDRYAEVRALADAYIDIVTRTARALGIPEVDEAGASPSLHDVPERVAGVVDALRFAAECLDHEWRGIDAGPPLYGDQGVNQAHRRIRQALDAMHDEPTDDDATQDPPGWSDGEPSLPDGFRIVAGGMCEGRGPDRCLKERACRRHNRCSYICPTVVGGGEVSDG